MIKTYFQLTEDELNSLYNKADNTNIDIIIFELEKKKDSSTIHNINKAISYLNYFSNQYGSHKRFIEKYDRLRELKMFCFCYLDYGDFKQLGKSMQSWF